MTEKIAKGETGNHSWPIMGAWQSNSGWTWLAVENGCDCKTGCPIRYGLVFGFETE